MSAPVTPGGGFPCVITLAAILTLFGTPLYLLVHLIVAVAR